MTKSSPTNFRWAVCCQTCCHFHEAPVATGEGECKVVNPTYEVLAGNICNLHKSSDDTQPTEEPGPTHIEYGMIFALISIAAIAVVQWVF